VPGAMLRGNLAEGLPFNTDYMLLKNDGDFKFSDISEQSNAAKYGFGWGVTITDFTNDGKMDLYFSQNYVRFPGVDILLPYPGRLLQQYPDGGFQAVETTSGLANKNFGITQVVSDFNQDGWPDIVLANLNGPMRAFLNQGGDRHSLTVHLPDGPAWLNTRVTVTKADGSKLTRQLFASEGLCSDSTDALFFGLGTFNGAVKVDVHGPGGETKSYANVSVDSILKVSK
ncbi:MAG: CRTAC1 family protein, partial [Planctomycetes bacterium]|nr:CRTAC1 family protein [Planctomycetota bacterium]